MKVESLAIRASERVMEASGILNSGQPNSVFINYTQVNLMSPAVKMVLERFAESLTLPDGWEDTE